MAKKKIKNKTIECPQCNGKGKLFSSTVHCGDDKCGWCNGTGKIIIINT